ncbi:MAG: SPOR domain-containing protein [Treponema sp.]|nr:SPOR domain-containing protein [Treponema sp.]
MEQKRTLWVIAASGVFLLVVVGAAVILYSPSVNKAQAAQAAVNPNTGWTMPNAGVASSTIDPFGLTTLQGSSAASSAPANPFDSPIQMAPETAVSGQESYAGIAQTGAPIQTGNVTVITDNTTVYGNGSTTTIDLNALKTTVSSNVSAQNAATEAQISEAQSVYDKRYTQSSPTYNYESEPAVSSASKAAPKAVASAKPAASAQAKSAAKPSAKSAASAKKAVAKTNAPAPASKIADKFWVQAASYSTKKSADDARTALETNKIPSEVFTYTDAKGKVFYRVRVGPYTTSSEAEYWKTQVAKIDRFADSQSYIVNSSAKAVK